MIGIASALEQTSIHDPSSGSQEMASRESIGVAWLAYAMLGCGGAETSTCRTATT
jgi:hypothetical protein